MTVQDLIAALDLPASCRVDQLFGDALIDAATGWQF